MYFFVALPVGEREDLTLFRRDQWIKSVFFNQIITPACYYILTSDPSRSDLDVDVTASSHEPTLFVQLEYIAEQMQCFKLLPINNL